MKVFDGICAMILMGFAIFCLIQSFRDVPVEPSWSWGFWAYSAGAARMFESATKEK